MGHPKLGGNYSLTEEEKEELAPYEVGSDKWRKKRHTIYGRRRDRKLRFQIFEKLGNICRRCGFDDYRAIHIDHINGGGNKERKKFSRSKTAYYRNILEKDCAGYQLLCANCNMIKKIENKEF